MSESKIRVPEINRIIIAGRLTRDPELVYTHAGKPICKCSVANSRRFRVDGKDGWQEETTFFEVVVFGPMAEGIGQRGVKGHPVLVEGRMRLNEWEDKQTGQKRSRLELVAERISPLEWHGTGKPADGNQDRSSLPRSRDDDESVYEDDIPF